MENLLKLDDLHVDIKVDGKYSNLLRGIDIDIRKGSIVGVVGESGSGKSVTFKSILNLMPDDAYNIVEGKAEFEDINFISHNKSMLYELLGDDICYIFQNTNQTLDSYRKIIDHFKEVFAIYGNDYDLSKVVVLMNEVGIDDYEEVLNMYPGQLSGGLSQRVSIALALLREPKLIIADEPTSSIDASLRNKVLNLFEDINQKHNTAVLIITHDFDVVKKITQEVVVMYGGIVMEMGDKDSIMEKPLSPYTFGLLKCSDSLINGEEKLFQIEGNPMSPANFIDQCPFVHRCDRRIEQCNNVLPEKRMIDGRYLRCHNPLSYVGGEVRDE